MTIWSNSESATVLFGLEGQLISLRISVEPRLLEDLLEALAQLNFPVNPQLYHRLASVTVEFPAYSARVDEVRDALRRHGFSAASLEVARGFAAAGADRHRLYGTPVRRRGSHRRRPAVRSCAGYLRVTARSQ